MGPPIEPGRFAGWLLPGVLAVCWINVARAEGPPADEVTIEPAQPQSGVDAPAPEPSTAREWYDHGISLGRAGDFVAAAAAFLRSYELQPTSEALYNAGFAYQQAEDAVAAIETYRRMLAEPERNEELARAAERSIAQLMLEVGTLKAILYAPSRPPAELYVAGQRRELDELPFVLPPGPVIIEVVDEHGVRARETYEIAAGEALVVDLRALLPALVEPPETNDPVEIEEGPSPEQLRSARLRARRVEQLRIATWVGLGLTGAAGISAGTLAGLASRERNAYLDTTCLQFANGDCPEGFVTGDPEKHLDAYGRFQLGMVVSAGVAGGLAIGTLVVGLVSLRLERKAPRERARVRLSPRPGGFAIAF